jgi:hypothetical protein
VLFTFYLLLEVNLYLHILFIRDMFKTNDPVVDQTRKDSVNAEITRTEQFVQAAAIREEFPGVPTYNHAAILGWGGMIDTDLNFNEFFSQDHTIMVRFMPRYPYAYAGPILAENGVGTYIIGQGDYRWGNGGFLLSGDPVILIKIGNSFATYLAPQIQRATWHHLTVIRIGNDFVLYLDSQQLGPPLKITTENRPDGTVRLGRRTNGRHVFRSSRHDGIGYPGQFFGMIDDLAVYKRALNQAEIRALMNGLDGHGRLTGYEPYLYAGWSFDVPGMNFERKRMPETLVRRYVMFQPNSSLLQVESDNRSNPNDGLLMDTYHTEWNLTLPFKKYEAWKVIQGYDDGSDDGSHNGYASFCLDFVRNDLPSSEGVTLVSSAPGRVEYVVETFPPHNAGQANEITFRFAEGLFYGFLHIEQGSVMRFGFEPSSAQSRPEWLRPFVGRDQEVAAVGDTGVPNYPHLHFGASNGGGVGADLVTIPIAFSDYWVLQGNNWIHVPLGIPSLSQVVMRRNCLPQSLPIS